LSALILSLALVAAASAQPGSTQPGSARPAAGVPAKAVAIFTDPSQPVEVNAKDTFRIVLASNPTTGYRWQLADGLDEAVLKLVHNRYRGPIARRPGAGGHEFWRFYAVAPGTAEIRMVYVRSWEKGVEPARTAVFKVTVK